MTRQMTATELKARLLAVLDEVAAGDEVDITEDRRLRGHRHPNRPAVW